MNSLYPRCAVFVGVLVLMVRSIATTGLVLTMLPLVAPLAWWLFFYWHNAKERAAISLPDHIPDRKAGLQNWATFALVACVAWLIAPLFVALGEWLNNAFAAISGGDQMTYFVLRAGMIEEVLKLSAVLLAIKYLVPGAINHPRDAILLSVASALGFAAYENIFHNLHLLQMENGAFTAFALGALVRVPLHPLYSVMWGTALGLALFTDRPARYIILGAGLLCAAIVHGLWDTLAQRQNVWIFVMMAAFYCGLWHSYFKLCAKISAIEIWPDSMPGK